MTSKFFQLSTKCLFLGSLISLQVACFSEDVPLEENADEQGHTSASQTTVDVQQSFRSQLTLSDQQDFIDARQGLIAQEDEVIVKNKEGKIIWDTRRYNFIEGEAPSTVNPSLWRQAKLNNIHGLFKVNEGIYQVRGYDLSNMTIIESDSGWVIVDPLTSAETAARAIKFARKHLNNESNQKPIKAVIFTHSHIDHFGGIYGVLPPEEAEKNKVRIIAPEGFMEAATSENILVGLAMGRRAMLMYGKDLARSERGHVGSGLGKSPAYGSFSILRPTELITHTSQKLNIDGLDFVFQYAPESEAPAELTFYLPKYQAFCGAELVSRNMHNLYTLRGAKIRDALKWSGYIEEARSLFSESKVYFASHHWPMWGQANIDQFLKKQRDTYKYTHDQSVRLINQGYTPNEIAEEIKLPSTLQGSFPNRGYYGTLKHNSKAVYQNYMGWYDANPAHLDPLPESKSAERYIALMGGSDKVLEAANKSIEQGEYRWAAELLNRLVFAKPNLSTAKAMLAKCYDQMGYQAESGPWRDVYLSAAKELRFGKTKEKLDPSLMKDVLKEAPSEYFMDAISVNLDGPSADGVNLVLNFTFLERNENFVITIENSVFHYKKASPDPSASASIKISRALFLTLITQKRDVGESLFGDNIQVEGKKLDLIKFLSLMKKPKGHFNIVTP